MKLRPSIAAIVLVVLGLLLSVCRAADEAPEAERPRILVHIMPWFESKDYSGAWGWHWTMGKRSPDRADASGRREIASHDYPVIGPYDSADPDLLEYHTLLMKIAGIDGVIADWYGSEDFHDYGSIHRRTRLLFNTVKQHGLQFAVCYEDRVLRVMSEKNKLGPAQAVEHARAHFRFCDENWFAEPLYAKWHGKPLLLVFGPDYLTASQWDVALAGWKHPPALFTLHETRKPAVGTFAWPPMWASKDGVLGEKELDGYFDRFYGEPGVKIAGAFPGFHDYYAEAGVQPTHGRLDARDGKTFRQSLERALRSKAPFIQIATWNDFGEGTTIEPTIEYKYRYLEVVQSVRKRSGSPLRYGPVDLQLPARIYALRKASSHEPATQRALDEVVSSLVGGISARASIRLDELERTSRSRVKPDLPGAGA